MFIQQVFLECLLCVLQELTLGAFFSTTGGVRESFEIKDRELWSLQRGELDLEMAGQASLRKWLVRPEGWRGDGRWTREVGGTLRMGEEHVHSLWEAVWRLGKNECVYKLVPYIARKQPSWVVWRRLLAPYFSHLNEEAQPCSIGFIEREEVYLTNRTRSGNDCTHWCLLM